MCFALDSLLSSSFGSYNQSQAKGLCVCPRTVRIPSVCFSSEIDLYIKHRGISPSVVEKCYCELLVKEEEGFLCHDLNMCNLMSHEESFLTRAPSAGLSGTHRDAAGGR